MVYVAVPPSATSLSPVRVMLITSASGSTPGLVGLLSLMVVVTGVVSIFTASKPPPPKEPVKVTV